MSKQLMHLNFIGVLLLAFFGLTDLNAYAQCATSINTFPYSEGFENDNGNWNAGGSGSDWQWGTPHKQVITAAASGNKCWIIDTLTQAYAPNAHEWIQSPCFDFSTLENPYIQFDIFWDSEPKYDGAQLISSIDGGNSWQAVGAYGDNNCGNANWFNYSGITYLSGSNSSSGWSGSVEVPGGGCGGGGGSANWLTAKHSVSSLAGQPSVIFRFMFAAGSKCNNYDGFAIDNILISDQPSTIIVTTQSTNITCNGGSNGSITTNVSGGISPYTYTWSPAVSDSFKAVNIPAATYTVSVADNNQCAVSKTVVITQPAAITISISAYFTTCKLNDGSAIANVNGGNSPLNYSWDIIHPADTVAYSNTGTLNQINSLIPGSYITLVKDANGCTGTSSAFAIQQLPPLRVSLGPDVAICPDTKLVLKPGNYQTYLWQDGSTDPTYTLSKPGVYWVKVTDNNSCTASDSVRISDGNCLGVYFPTAFTPNGDGIDDKFGMAGPIGPITNYHLRIYNRWGQLVFESYDLTNKWDGKVNGFINGTGTFVWDATFISNNKQTELKGSVLVID